jgi:hypothetical protein
MVPRWSSLSLLCCATILLVVAARALAQGRSSTAPNAALVEAVRALTAEAEAHLKNGGGLREKCNYFAAGQTQVSESELLEAMSRRISRNAFVDAYVKWQLTSGLPTKISDENLRLAVRVFRSAPELQRLPGTTPQEQQQLDQAIQGAKEMDIPTLNEKWRSRVDPVVQMNEMSLNFRDTFGVRLPTNPDTVELLLMDAVQRTEAGLDVKRYTEALMVMIRGWAVEGAPPGQLNRVANMFAKLRDQQGATIFTSVQWDEKKKMVVWKKETRRVNPKYDAKSPDEDAFLRLSVELQGYARNPSGGLKLKDK